jgi:tetratricopeptide (TPR) repeat protein
MLRAPAVLALSAALGVTVGCASGLVPKPPRPEDEVARLRREITKVRFAVDSTKELIDRSRGQPYLPDLYMRLSELHVEEARYHYFIAYEGTKRRERAVTSVQARLLKNQAIGVYKRILDEFPTYPDRDKVLFYIAHELRELGEYPDMLKYLERVIAEHEQSVFRNESLLVVGDYYFDQSELKTAERYYKRILATPESASHGMARYKLAWVRINETEMKAALKLFEETIEGLERLENDPKLKLVDKKVDTPRGPGSARRLDLRREALVDMVYPYVDVHKKPDVGQTLTYFRRLAVTRTSYLAALSKLARRWFVKGEYNYASQVYRELLALGAEDDETLEWARRLYDGAVKGQQWVHVATDVQILAGLGAAKAFDWRLPPQEREHLRSEFEAYARDLGTKAQLAASKTNDVKLYALAADAYDAYLRYFGHLKEAQAIRQNLADARFAAKQFYAAGRAYEIVMDGLGAAMKTSTAAAGLEGDRKEAIYTAVVAYTNALKEPTKMSRLELVESRAGLRRAAVEHIARYPRDEAKAAVKFNLAKSYYDEGRFEEAAEYFAALVDEFPNSQEGSIAAELALDALRARDAFEEMAQLGKRLGANDRISATVRKELAEIVESAEGRALERATLMAGYQGDEAVEGLIAFAERHRGTELGEKALINAFATARNSDDLERVAAIGRKLVEQYPQSKVVPDVLATLGNMSAQAVDFDRAAKYLEEAARRSSSKDSTEMMRSSALIKAHLGDTAGAKEAYQRVIETSAPGAQKREAALGLAEILERAGDYKGAVEPLQLASQEGGRSAAVEFRLGYALMQAGRGGEAARAFQAAYELGRGAQDAADREGAAGGAFFLSASQLQEVQGIGYDGGTAQAIQRKFGAIQAFEERMYAIIELQSPRFALASLSRLATVYEDGARFLEKAPAPAGLDGAGAEKFQAALRGRAQEFRNKSKEAQDTCASKATELKVLAQPARACLQGEPLDGDPVRRAPLPRRSGSPGDVSDLQKRIAKNSKDYEALGELAKRYLAVDDPYAAKLVLDKAAEGGATAEIYNLRGVTSYLLGDHEDARDEFESALRQDAGHARAHLNLAGLYRSYGMNKLAEAELVKLAPGTPVDPRDAALIAPARSGGSR